MSPLPIVSSVAASGAAAAPELISKLSIVLPPIEKFVMGASVVAPKNVRVDDAERGVLE
jgi:hypothetical protein